MCGSPHSIHYFCPPKNLPPVLPWPKTWGGRGGGTAPCAPVVPLPICHDLLRACAVMYSDEPEASLTCAPDTPVALNFLHQLETRAGQVTWHADSAKPRMILFVTRHTFKLAQRMWSGDETTFSWAWNLIKAHPYIVYISMHVYMYKISTPGSLNVWSIT